VINIKKEYKMKVYCVMLEGDTNIGDYTTQHWIVAANSVDEAEHLVKVDAESDTFFDAEKLKTIQYAFVEYTDNKPAIIDYFNEGE